MKHKTSSLSSSSAKESANTHRAFEHDKITDFSKNITVETVYTYAPHNLLSSEIIELMPLPEEFKQNENNFYENQDSNPLNTISLNAYISECYLLANVSFKGLTRAEFIAECLKRNDADELAEKLIEYRRDIEDYYSKYGKDNESLVTVPSNKQLLDYTEEQIRNGITGNKESDFDLVQFLTDENCRLTDEYYHLFAEVGYKKSSGIFMNAGICEDGILMNVSVPLSEEEKAALYSLINKEIKLDKFSEADSRAAYNSKHPKEYGQKKMAELYDAFAYDQTYDSIPDTLKGFDHQLSSDDGIKTEVYKIVPKTEYLEQIAQSNGYNEWAKYLMIDNADKFMYVQQLNKDLAVISQFIMAETETCGETIRFSFHISQLYDEVYRTFAKISKEEYSKCKNQKIER